MLAFKFTCFDCDYDCNVIHPNGILLELNDHMGHKIKVERTEI